MVRQAAGEGQLSRFDLIASEGLARLGGDDFDELIVRAAGVEPTASALERAREAKETLKATTRQLVVELGDAPITHDTADLYARAAPLIERTIAQTDLLFRTPARARHRSGRPARARRPVPGRRRRGGAVTMR